ncbi:MAG: hypothetical protein IJ535_09985 [Pseudobutyrivibrio sp.]|uniref:hypothetical protein n=1 Tax=Pseudobutyrivibrio sp. TaxID=2014367 RepID=UPI0025D75789|nr:hypothetical protein [Pseudobutyrivibrio sp.]MBQ8490094.1 hypothetical protein [Pseudobutyrivibrio sp.]
MLLCYKIENGKVQICDDVFYSNINSSETYLLEISRYYSSVTGQDLNVNIFLDDNIPALSISMEKKVIFQSELIKLKDVAMYLYFPHEIFHQIIGNQIRFEGEGKLWMMESFTEYMQWRYLLESNKAMAKRLLGFYFDRYFTHAKHDVSLVKAGNNTSDDENKATVESRGVLLFIYYFWMVDDIKLKKLLKEMREIKVININKFMELSSMAGVDTDELYACLKQSKNVELYKNFVHELGNRL